MKRVINALVSFILAFIIMVAVPYLFIQSKVFPLSSRVSFITVGAFILGAFCIATGLVIMIYTIWFFKRLGIEAGMFGGNPPAHLVVVGMYAYVRNPIFMGIALVLLGEAFIYLSFGLLAWFAVFIIGSHFYITYKEEPDLLKKFGSEFMEYRANVPKWIPSAKPWKPRHRSYT